MSNLKKQSSIINFAIIVIAVIAIFYVVLQILGTKRISTTDNPFEYNIEHYKETSIEPSFVLAQTLTLQLDKPNAIAITPQNELVVAGSSAVHIYNVSLNLVHNFTLPEPATCVDFLNDTIYVGLQSAFATFLIQGNPLTYHKDDENKSYFTSIAVNKKFIFLADAGNRVVKKYAKDGRLVARIGEANKDKGIPKLVIPSPYFDIALENANLWLVNPGKHMLSSFTEDGDFRSSWEKTSMHIDGFSGCCNPSHIAILPDGSFVTSEKGLVRIKIHDQHGEFKELVAGTDQFPASETGLDLAVDTNENIYVLVPSQKEIRIYSRK